jgi:peptidoglycan hydrolase-like protein with peptidoglycan-binding domain
VLGAAGAWGAASPEHGVIRQANLLKTEAARLRLADDAPDLYGQLGTFVDRLDAWDKADAAASPRTAPIRADAETLRSDLIRSKRPMGAVFCARAADRAQSIADRTLALLEPTAPGASPSNPPASPYEAIPAHFSAASDRIHSMLAGGKPAEFASAPTTAAAPPLQPAPRRPALGSEPTKNGRIRDVQEALNALRQAAGQGAIAADGRDGSGTKAAVKDFQKRNGLKATGVVDGETERKILTAYQIRAGLPATGALDDATQKALPYYAGKPSDFEPGPAQKTVRNATITVYYPFLAKTAAKRRMEGPTHDRFGQTICTLEKFLDGACPYVSVAIDPRLRVPDGTPVRIPEIDAAAGRPVLLRIVDTGSPRYFKGTGHVDVATDSDESAGLGRELSGRRCTLLLPQGLRPSL